VKAFVVERYGEDGLRAADVPEPGVGDGEVLVEVSAAGVKPLDMMVRDGEFKRLLKYRTPFVLGHDVAGVGTGVGSAVRHFRVGDEVYARPRDLRIGTFAEYIAIDQHDVAPKPGSLSLQEAAAVPLVSLAAWQALVERAHAQPGQRGPRPRRLRWPGVDRDPARQAPRRHGGDDRPGRERGAGAQPRRGRRRGLHQGGLRGGPLRLRRRVGLAGGQNLERSLTVLKPGGQAIGVTGPPDPGFAKQLGAPQSIGVVTGLPSRKVRKQARKLGVSYSFLFMQANGAQLRELTALYETGRLRPVIDKTFPFGQTRAALAYLEQGRANGKVVITLD
jgi:NADPH:quinone reductase-like Zn-dependent oxidoreductase